MAPRTTHHHRQQPKPIDDKTSQVRQAKHAAAPRVSRREAIPYARSPTHRVSKTVVKEDARGRKTVSIKPNKIVDTRKHRYAKYESPTPEPDIIGDFGDNLYRAREIIREKLQQSFADIHNQFFERLVATRTNDAAFLESISNKAATINAPLLEEKLETISTKSNKKGSDKRASKTVTVVDRIKQFQENVEREIAELDKNWMHWEGLQNDFEQLGVEVLGPKAFSNRGEDEEVRGFKKEMEGLCLERDQRVGEMTDAIDAVGQKVLQKMKASEKELADATKDARIKILQAIMNG